LLGGAMAVMEAASLEVRLLPQSVWPGSYSIFDSRLCGILEAEWLFPQEKAAFHNLQTPTCESKVL